MSRKFELNLGAGVLNGLEELEEQNAGHFAVDDMIKNELICKSIIDKIDFSDTTLTNRIDYDQEKIDDLVESIKSIGLLNPILLTEQKTEEKVKYKIIAGYRRATAIKKIYEENPTVEVKGYFSIYNIEKIDNIALEQISFEENHKRENLREIEISLAIKKMRNYLPDDEETDDKIMKIFNIKRRNEYLRLKEISEKYPIALIEQMYTIGFTKAKEIFQFINKYIKYKGYKKEDLFIKNLILELAELTKEELREKIRELKEKDFEYDNKIEARFKIGKKSYKFEGKTAAIINRIVEMKDGNPERDEIDILESLLNEFRNR